MERKARRDEELMRMRRKAGKPERISIEAEHARVFSLKQKERIKFNGQPELVKRVADEQLPPGYSAAMVLANLLYPNNFPEVVASHRNKNIIFSKKVFLDEKSQRGIEGHYKAISLVNFWPLLDFFKHWYDIRKEAKVKAGNIDRESGIRVNAKVMNVGRAKEGGDLVFFEVAYINLPVLERKVNSLPEKLPAEMLKKKQAFELLSLLKKEAKGKKYIDVHI